ncbi:MAG: tetratricopeptide repeat protein [Candidatus Omnitrophota bacterium]
MLRDRKEQIVLLVIFVLVFGVYINSLPGSFVFDDMHMIVKNNYIKSTQGLTKLFGAKITSVIIPGGMYRPVLMLTYAFNYAFGALNPYGYHIINILIHFLNAVLLYLILNILFRDLNFYLMLFLVALFCVHPINTEAVTYLSSRSTILCAFFILVSFYNYILWRRSGKVKFQALSLVSYILALLTKEIGLVLVLLVSLYEFVYSEDIIKEKKRIFFGILPYLILSAGYLFILKFIFKNQVGMFVGLKRLVRPLSANIYTQSAVAFFYLYLFFFPFKLTIDHNFPVIRSLGNLPEMVPFLALVVLIIIFLRIKRSHRLLSFSFFWYLAALSPQFYARLNLTAAEHHAYPAYLAVYFILALALGNKKLNNIYIKYAAVFIILLFSLLTIIRNFEWRNENSLWSSSRRTNPRSGIASGNLGILLIKQGIYDEGKKYLEQASRFSQEESPKITSTLNLAYYYALNKEPQKGLDILTRQKEYLSQAKPVVYYKTLAYIYFQMGKVKEAQRIMQDLIRQFTESAELKAILGWFYLNDPLNKDKENARSYFERPISLIRIWSCLIRAWV